MHPVLRQVLSRRKLESPQDLDLALQHLTPVGRFDALAKAVALLLEHRERRVVVVGDFDADGATSAALTVLTLRKLGFRTVDYFIPDRFELGYGLSPEAVERLAALAPTLIVTVDNGISSVEGVRAARAAGIDVLITDHHLAPDELPDANAIVNPNLPGDLFPGKHLAGVGVAFYLLASLGRALGRAAAVSEFLDLVALGTVADLVVLDRSNRILVEQGLTRIRAGRCRPGISALCAAAGVDMETLGASALGYQIAPRLNAAGRLDDMSVGVRCLLSASRSEADELAAELDGLNRERREIEARMKAEAIHLMEQIDVMHAAELPHAICLQQTDWHEGLVGLIAARIKERYHRPAFAFAATGAGKLKGSGRSVSGFHLRDALAAIDARHPGMLQRFGGHAMAAGLTLAASDFERFRDALESVARDRLDAESLAECVFTDGELQPAELNIETALVLRAAGPWGQGFPEPVFDGCFELLDYRILKEAHLKMTLRPRTGSAPIEAIAFNRPNCEWTDGDGLRLVYRLGVNDYFRQPKAQLVVEHIEAEVDAAC
jgi:single-stranded-DNA-specific exonuclease